VTELELSLSVVLLSTLVIDSDGLAALTAVPEVDELLALAGSKVLALTVAVLFTVLPAAEKATVLTRLNTSLAPLITVGLVQVMVPLAPAAGVLQVQPTGAVRETKPSEAGSVSVRLTVEASLPPALATGDRVGELRARGEPGRANRSW
jgi:hypothetical protein